MDNENKQLNAVYEKDLDNLLRKMGIKEDFDAGKIKCKFCKETISKENLHSILPQASAFNLICDKPECVIALAEYLDERKKVKTDL